MNPLPNRPLLNNPTAPLSLPNVPSFEQIAYNGRPRKVLPEAAKEFPLLNGMHTSTPPPGSASTLSQLPSMERSHINIQQQPSLPQLPSQTPGQQPPSNPISQSEKDEAESRQVTAIFGPEDIGEWKDKPRFMLETPEKSRLRDFTPVDAGGWDGRDDDEPKEEEGEVDEEEVCLVGDGESTKIWKAKRTLRKLVYL
jgi:striatin 1/3/4